MKYLFLALILLQLMLYVAHPTRMINAQAAQVRWSLFVAEICPYDFELWVKK